MFHFRQRVPCESRGFRSQVVSEAEASDEWSLQSQAHNSPSGGGCSLWNLTDLETWDQRDNGHSCQWTHTTSLSCGKSRKAAQSSGMRLDASKAPLWALLSHGRQRIILPRAVAWLFPSEADDWQSSKSFRGAAAKRPWWVGVLTHGSRSLLYFSYCLRRQYFSHRTLFGNCCSS